MTTAEKIAVMQAFEDGKQIEFRRSFNNNNVWIDCGGPVWNWDIYEYRIKPEEKKLTYRPYKDTYEMIADYKERFNIDVPCYAMPLIWVRWKDADIIKFITAFRENRVTVAEHIVSLDYMYASYVYLDGSPVGKLVEE